MGKGNKEEMELGEREVDIIEQITILNNAKLKTLRIILKYSVAVIYHLHITLL